MSNYRVIFEDPDQKDIPRHIWSVEYNRPMFKIVKTEDVPSDRSFRNAWRIAA